MIAAVHLPAAVSIPPALLVAVAMLWYWTRLGAAGIPESRRRIRRASMVVVMASLPLLVVGMSFVDADTNPGGYVMTWTAVFVSIGLVVITAVADLANTARLARNERRESVIRAAAAMGRRGRRSSGGGREASA